MAANKFPTDRTFADDAVRGRIRIAAGLALTLALVLVWRFYVLQVSEYERCAVSSCATVYELSLIHI